MMSEGLPKIEFIRGGRPYSRPMRPDEVRARQAAMEAARLVIGEGIPTPDALKRVVGAERSSTIKAIALLKFGTPEEIASVETGRASMRAVTRAITDRTPKEDQKQKRRMPIRGADARQHFKDDARIWRLLDVGLDGLSSLPRPTDVVALVKRSRGRQRAVNAKLLAVFTWITEFSDAWTNQRPSEGNDHAATSNGVAGAEQAEPPSE